MSEVLSQEEIDSLLNAISSGEVSEEERRESWRDYEQRRVHVYDFRRPELYTKENLRHIQYIFEQFCREFSVTLAEQFNRELAIGIHVGSVDQLTYEEFVRSIPIPTTFSVFYLDPVKAHGVIEIDPSITQVIIEALLGNRNKHKVDTRMDPYLTDIELSLMEGIIVRGMGCLRQSFSDVIDLRPRLETIEVNPQYCDAYYKHKSGILVTIEVKIHETYGMINFFIPNEFFLPIKERLTGRYWYGAKNKHFEEEEKDYSNITTQVELAACNDVYVSYKDLCSLQKGSLIMLGDEMQHSVKKDGRIFANSKKITLKNGRIVSE